MNKHIRLTGIPNFDDVVNLKQYFVMFDSLKNIENDLAFSVLTKYHCRAKCDVCYIKSLWSRSYFDPTKSISFSTLFDFLSYFETVCAHDDLFFLKASHPYLYRTVFVEQGQIFSSSSMTDRAFVQQWKLLLTELNFKDIDEVSFSEEFLSTHNWRLAKWVMPRLRELARKYRIRKIKMIFSQPKPQRESLKFLRELEDLGLSVIVHDDIRFSRNIRHNERNTITTKFDYEGYSYPLLTECCYFQQSQLFNSLPDATLGEYPIFTLGHTFDPAEFILAALNSKKASYSRYAQALSGKVSNKYTDYYNYIANELRVNPNFNFIPSILLNPESRFYKRMSGPRQPPDRVWLDTKAGLVLKSALESKAPLVSPIDLPKSKQKLEYFRIKCKRGGVNASPI